jgi:choline dehydrogenase
MSVVDGIESLRVADSSIMPRITTGNTIAPCVVVEERAGNLMRATHGRLKHENAV